LDLLLVFNPGAVTGFQNPPVGLNGIITRNSFQSSNYVPGVSGWAIFRNGNAEFNNLTVRGSFYGQNFEIQPAGIFVYDGTPALGNLICAITGTSASGTDRFGNVYTPGGECLIAEPLATNLFSMIDQATPPNVLAQIGTDGSISSAANISATTDLFVGGLSVPNDIIAPMPQGSVARCNVFASSLPAPATPTSSEFYLYELDYTIPANGRDWMLLIEPIAFSLSGAGKMRLTVYATTDGSQPTNASPIVISSDTVCGGVTANFTFRTPSLYHPFTSTAGTLWRFLVSLNTVNTGAGVPTMQMQVVDQNPGTDSQVQARFEIYDMGATVPNTGRQILATAGGSGGGTQNYTKTYTSTASHSYQGSNGSNPNLKINDNGSAYQGGNVSNTYNGSSKTWYEFNTGTIQSDLSGATINWVKVYLNNNHTWYGSGMNAAIGYDNITGGFGATRGDPSGGGVDLSEPHYNQGQAKWVTVPNSFGTAFQSGAGLQIVLFKNSTNLQYYGYFQGNNGCKLQVNYTK